MNIVENLNQIDEKSIWSLSSYLSLRAQAMGIVSVNPNTTFLDLMRVNIENRSGDQVIIKHKETPSYYGPCKSSTRFVIPLTKKLFHVLNAPKPNSHDHKFICDSMVS